MPSINLAPGTQYVVAARKRRVRVFAIAGIVAIIFIVIAVGLFAYNQQISSSQATLNDQVRSVELNIAAIGEDTKRVELFENRLKDLDDLLDKHISLEPLFQDIERLLPAGTTLTTLEIDVENATVHMQGTTTDVDQVAQAIASLVDAETHKTVFTRSTFKSIQRNEITNEEAVSIQYTFGLVLTFNPSILRAIE